MIAKAGECRLKENQVTELFVESDIASGHWNEKCRRNAQRAQA